MIHNCPVRIGYSWEVIPTNERHPIHVPDVVHTTCIPPENVGLAVTVEVTNTHNCPVRVGYSW